MGKPYTPRDIGKPFLFNLTGSYSNRLQLVKKKKSSVKSRGFFCGLKVIAYTQADLSAETLVGADEILLAAGPTVSFEDVPKAIIMRRTEGLIKMAIHLQTKQILVGEPGIEPGTSKLSVWRSTTEPFAPNANF